MRKTPICKNISDHAVGFLREGLHLIYIGVARCLAHLDVAVAGFGARGTDAEGHQYVVLGGEFQFFEDAVFEGSLVEDNLVGRCDGDGGIFVETQDAVDSPGYARRGVSLHGLYDELVVADVWELLADEGGIVVVGRDEDVVLGQNLHKPVVGLLQQRAARTEKVKELFRLVLAT